MVRIIAYFLFLGVLAIILVRGLVLLVIMRMVVMLRLGCIFFGFGYLMAAASVGAQKDSLD